MINIFKIFKESTNSFEGQQPGERVIVLVRRHPFYIIMKFFLAVVVVIIPALLISMFAPTLISHNLAALSLFVLGIWTMLVWLVFFYHFTMYTLDVWIITDQRIIDSTQHGFFSRTTSELHVTRVQDISVDMVGFVQTILHFGDVEVQTAGTEEKFKFMQVPQPEKIKNEIMRIAGVSQHGGHV